MLPITSHGLPNGASVSNRRTVKFTQKLADALKLDPGRDEAIVFDELVPGLGLRLRAAGSRTWIYQFSVGTKQRRMTLGKASALPLDRARETARDLYARSRLGFDPASERDERREKAAETLDVIVDRYLTRKANTVRPKTLVELRYNLSQRLKALHGLQMAQVDQRSIAQQLSRIEEESGPAARNAARKCISGFWVWAMQEGLAEANPVINTGRAEERSRDRVLTSDEITVVWRALADDDFGDIVRLLILTGQRREEIGGLLWREIDLDAGKLTLSPHRVKNGREHIVPLSATARAILEARRRNGRDYVFGRGEGGFSGWSRCKERLDRRIGALPSFVLHDIRRSVATGMGDLGIQPHVVEAVLNHISGHKAGVAGIYNRNTYEPEKRAALKLWAEHLVKSVR